MKLLNVTRTYRNLVRIKEILQVLTKHGFGHVVSRMNIALYVPNLRYLGILTTLPPYLSEESTAARIKMVLQELGPTFVKLGQILSGRPDILADEFIQEFKELQDNVPPFPVAQALEIIQQEFKAPAEDIFFQFDEDVLASGSIGQVHCARLPDGREVIVKIKRPGIGKIIATDVAILRFLADLAEKYLSEMKIFQPAMIVDEFSRTLQRELDFTAEAAYTEKFYSLLKQEEHVSSPKVFWEYTTQNIITLQKLHGTNIGDQERLKQQGINPKDLAPPFISCFMKQYFVWGLFHGDPHPGNILVSESGKIFLVDFGMVGHLSNELKSQLATTVLALVKNDLETIIEIYADIGVFTESVNEREIKRDILEILDKYFNTPFYHLDIGKVFQDIVRLARNHKVILPRDFVLLGKSLVMAASLARELDPQFNLAKAASPYVVAILREKFSPKRILNMTIFQMWSLGSLLQKLPSELKGILRRIKRGNLRLTISHEGMDGYIQNLDKIANRISFSIIIAAIIIGSSLLTLKQTGPQEMPIIGIIGYIMAAVMGLWLFFGILRSGRF